MDFETMHKNALKNIEEAQAESLIRIADALETIALPFTLLKNELEKQTKEKRSWEEQARYYQNACSEKNEKIRKLESAKEDI